MGGDKQSKVNSERSIVNDNMPEILNEEQYQSRSEIDDLIGNPPGWLLRSGIGSVALVAVALVAMSGFIRYPDKTEAVGVLSAEFPPIEHFARTAGVVESILFSDGDEVMAGDEVLYIYNLTDKEHLAVLQEFLAEFRNVDFIPDYLELEFPGQLKLGELQAAYSRLQLAFDAFINDLKQSGVFVRLRTLQEEIRTTQSLIAILERDKNYLEEEKKLAEKDYNRYRRLWEEEVYSDREMEQAEAEWIRFRKQLNAVDQNVLQQQLRVHQLESEMQNITEGRTSLIAEHLYRIQDAINSLEQAIREWRETWYVRAETSGKLSMRADVVPGLHLRQGVLVFTIVPELEKSSRFVRLQLPTQMMARIEQGSQALIKFDNYPHKEWGMIRTQVTHISLVPAADQDGILIYELRLDLPEKLITTYGKELEYRPRAGVRVDIITEDRSILERIFNQIFNLIKNQTQ